mmetsp:Transcript_22280/g.67724  ORF Transcript_22280/g.67724 Transcript_22280/m.67724 type:complete len:87 (-) Transcript_22280:119-379(-)
MLLEAFSSENRSDGCFFLFFRKALAAEVPSISTPETLLDVRLDTDVGCHACLGDECLRRRRWLKAFAVVQHVDERISRWFDVDKLD